MDAKTIRMIQDIISTHDKFRNSYFWSPPRNSSSRRSMEFEHEYEFKYKEKTYNVLQTLSCSCKNVYYKLAVFVDGTQKDVRVLKTIVKKEG